ncbi:hypothetical protein NBE99_11535 [Thermosynechococcus sp. HN-54]|uniref:hypothetical protein n=1 Tax=Thermosynechococcus sp. HN-54 TaxID=2933959 RepID=UPI00202D0051|nr:hypothetical protein [Thermosynechococcus sp. HN-54]URR35258.1 hypothetical protein NBE99_11535 [Thermosynechococcus sp. HN-54]
MVRGGVYEQFRGALLGLLWGIAKEDLNLAQTLPHQWLTHSQGDWWSQLPQLLAAWDQPLISVPAELQEIQTLLHEYLEAAWAPEPLPLPSTREDIVRYALAIAPWDLELAHEIVIKQQPSAGLLLSCLFGAYWGALALPLSAWEHWTPTVAEVLANVMAQWTGGIGTEIAVAPKAGLKNWRGGCIRNIAL